MKLLITLLVLAAGFLLTTRVLPFVFVRAMRLLGFRMRMSPLAAKRLRRFRSIRRGYYSFLILSVLFVTSSFLEVLVNHRPIYLRYGDHTAWPALRDLGNQWLFFLKGPFAAFDRSGDFGHPGEGPLDYRAFSLCVSDPAAGIAPLITAKEQELAQLRMEHADIEAEIEELRGSGEEPEEWLLDEFGAAEAEQVRVAEEMEGLRTAREIFSTGRAAILWPLYPHSPYQTRLELAGNPPLGPSLPFHRLFRWAIPSRGEMRGVPAGDSADGAPPRPPEELGIWEAPLGTDASGVDVLPQLLYGFRISVGFALIVATIGYLVGVIVGGLMGYLGGWTDILLQRLIEIWGSIPFLFTIMIIAAVINPRFLMLVGLLVILRSWLAITYLIRGEFYREKARDYVQAAIGCGVSDWKVMAKHILPNSLVPVISRAPFSFVNYISALVALDFLGFGLPPTTPSWGRLLRQGFEFILSDPHLVIFPVLALAATLFLAVMIGEAVREAFDPKVFSRLR